MHQHLGEVAAEVHHVALTQAAEASITTYRKRMAWACVKLWASYLSSPQVQTIGFGEIMRMTSSVCFAALLITSVTFMSNSFRKCARVVLNSDFFVSSYFLVAQNGFSMWERAFSHSAYLIPLGCFVGFGWSFGDMWTPTNGPTMVKGYQCRKNHVDIPGSFWI